jgi:predicted DNA binding CopG/RHH family protein
VGPEEVTRILARNERMRAERAAKDAKFTARANAHDLERFKMIAVNKRILYQTLLGHVLHKYVSGELVDVEEIRKVFPALKKKKVK